MTSLTITRDAAKEAGEHVSSIIHEHYGDTVVLLAGGSALDIIEYIEPGKKCFHQECQTKISGDKKNICQRTECRTIFIMGDERVSREAEINNYLQLESRYSSHQVKTLTMDTMPLENESTENFAARINDTFLKKLSELNNPKIISILGIGKDGHTAGIFPMDEVSFRRVYQDDQTYVPVHVEDLKIDSRASFTPSWLLNNTDELIGYAVGSDKKEILEKLNFDTKKLNERPSELLNLHRCASIYTDQDIDME
ncbi:MAG: 6-phosphogluconolactonase/glucosamine-6-phosphate isomerase/deaminase [Candidatus Paceibacteria bacterium]|jgi:6-phosphogluconolactonase/glucosamine-6-phosphate isomerase/deaminase